MKKIYADLSAEKMKNLHAQRIFPLYLKGLPKILNGMDWYPDIPKIFYDLLSTSVNGETVGELVKKMGEGPDKEVLISAVDVYDERWRMQGERTGKRNDDKLIYDIPASLLNGVFFLVDEPTQLSFD